MPQKIYIIQDYGPKRKIFLIKHLIKQRNSYIINGYKREESGEKE